MMESDLKEKYRIENLNNLETRRRYLNAAVV
jgi:hypothetical protein